MVSFSDAWVSFDCPACGYSIDVQLVDSKSETTVFCHNCKRLIQLHDQEASVHSGLGAVDEALRKLQEAFKKFGK